MELTHARGIFNLHSLLPIRACMSIVLYALFVGMHAAESACKSNESSWMQWDSFLRYMKKSSFNCVECATPFLSFIISIFLSISFFSFLPLLCVFSVALLLRKRSQWKKLKKAKCKSERQHTQRRMQMLGGSRIRENSASHESFRLEKGKDRGEKWGKEMK